MADDDHLLLGSSVTGRGLWPVTRKGWIKVGVVLGVILLIVLAGVLVGVLSRQPDVKPTPPPVTPNTTTTTTAKPTTTTTTKPTTTTTTKPTTTTTTKPTTTTTTKPTTTTTTKPTTTTQPTTTTFPPPTERPLPVNATDYPPVDLLHLMGMHPVFNPFSCQKTWIFIPVAYKYNVTVADHTFTSEGGDTKDIAKDGAAMVANEELFGIKYPSIPVPKRQCNP